MQAGVFKKGFISEKCIHSLTCICNWSVQRWPDSSPKGAGPAGALAPPTRRPPPSSRPGRWCVPHFEPELLQNVRFRIETAPSFPRRLPLRPHIHRWVTFLRLFDVLSFQRLTVFSLWKAWRGIFTHVRICVAWRGIFTHVCRASGKCAATSLNLHVGAFPPWFVAPNWFSV